MGHREGRWVDAAAGNLLKVCRVNRTESTGFTVFAVPQGEQQIFGGGCFVS